MKTIQAMKNHLMVLSILASISHLVKILSLCLIKIVKILNLNKATRLKKLYGKSKSPSENLNNFIPPHEHVFRRNSPLGKSVFQNLNNSSNQFQDSQLNSSTSWHVMNHSKSNNQRSRHNNSIKYCNSVTIGPKIKQKSNSKKSKVKKGNSFGKIPHYKMDSKLFPIPKSWSKNDFMVADEYSKANSPSNN